MKHLLLLVGIALATTSCSAFEECPHCASNHGWSPPVPIEPEVEIAYGAHAPTFWMPSPTPPIPPATWPRRTSAELKAELAQSMHQGNTIVYGDAWIATARWLAQTCRLEEMEAGDEAAKASSKTAWDDAVKARNEARSCTAVTYNDLINHAQSWPKIELAYEALAEEESSLRPLTEQEGQTWLTVEDGARYAWAAVIDRAPTSPLGKVGLRMHADVSLREGLRSAGSLPAARAAIDRALAGGSDDDRAYLDAQMGFAVWSAQDLVGAAQWFKDSVDEASKVPMRPFAREIKTEAQNALVQLKSQVVHVIGPLDK